MKKTTWLIKDIIDLEYFLYSDVGMESESTRQVLLKRDRGIYLNKILPLEKDGVLTPKKSIRVWLEQIRKIKKKDRATGALLPGETFHGVCRIMGFCLLILGLLSGYGMTVSFLNYRGMELLNVSYYLMFFVFAQFFAVLFLLVIFLVRKVVKCPFRISIIYTLVSGFMTRVIIKIKHHTLKNLDVSDRAGFETVMGMIRGKGQVYGSLFYWPVFILIQIFGIGFNLGVLGTTFIRVLISDIAFGWQSTVQVSDQTVFKLVQVVSLPWAWMVKADFGHPTFDQIQGSHMVLKDGIYHLSTNDLVSWWPFLCFAVLTYGLLPRLILLAAGIVVQKKVLSKICFRHKSCGKLLNRMRTPLISTEGNFVDSGNFHQGDSVKTSVEDIPEGKLDVLKVKGIVVLVPDDIFEAFTDDELESVILKIFGHPVQLKFRLDAGEEEDNRIIHELSNMNKEGLLTNLLILQEAWQPPIRESLLFIRDLRKALGKSSMIWVGLIGLPRQGIVFTSVKEQDLTVWRQKLNALGDSYIGIEELVPNGE